MQQRILLFLSFSFLLFSCGGREEAKTHEVDREKLRSFPKLEQVLNYFDNHYSVPESIQLNLIKNPEGFSLVTTENKSGEEKILPFWLLSKKDYVPLPEIFTKKENSLSLYKLFINQSYRFDHSLYLNYPEAANDAIHELENATNLDDTLLEALSRAYTMKTDEIKYKDRKSGIVREKMTADEARQFSSYGNKMLNTLEQLQSKNPDYVTLVGKIGHRIANDRVSLWYDLSVHGFDQEGRTFLSKGIYDEFSLHFARNILSSCEKNAILFTSGDNDTYPLWYVQEIESYRKDVAVINISLSNLIEYNQYHLYKNNLNSSLSEEVYANRLLEYIFVSTDRNAPRLVVDSLFAILKNFDKTSYKQSTPDGDLLLLPFSGLQIPFVMEEENTIRTRAGAALTWDFERYYLSTSDIFQIDVLSSNTDRPVYYTYPGGNGMDMSCMNYIENHGLVNQIHWYSIPENYDYYYPYFNDTLLRNLMLDRYDYSSSSEKDYEVNSIALSYFHQLVTVASQLKKKNKIPLAREFLKAADEKIRIDRIRDNQTGLFFAGVTAVECRDTLLGKKFWSLLMDEMLAENSAGIAKEKRNQYLDMLFTISSMKEQIKDDIFIENVITLSKEIGKKQGI